MAKMTKKGQAFVGDEISHLMKDGPSKGPQKDKKMPQKQAIAVALDVARRKGFKSSPNPNESANTLFDFTLIERVITTTHTGLKDRKDEDMSIFDSIVQTQAGTGASIFDGFVEAETPTSLFDDVVESNSGGASLFDEFTGNDVKSEADWDDRVARALTLAEELVEIRSSVKSK